MRKIFRIGFIHALAGAALAMGIGCAQTTDGTNNPNEPQSLRDVEIPEDFTFATSRGVALTVSATQENIGAESGALEIARADGRVLYRGPLSVQQPLSLNLAVPTKDNTVKLRLSANGQEHTAEVSLQDNAASHSF